MSPTHLATMRTIMMGKPNVMFPVASMMMTVKLMVILTMPPTNNHYHTEINVTF